MIETNVDDMSPQVFGHVMERALEMGALDCYFTANCELCFVIGTSALVYPAAGLPEIARAAGAFVCEVNPEKTSLSDLCDELLMGRAGEVLPLISQ